jgi:hypothetical protein
VDARRTVRRLWRLRDGLASGHERRERLDVRLEPIGGRLAPDGGQQWPSVLPKQLPCRVVAAGKRFGGLLDGLDERGDMRWQRGKESRPHDVRKELRIRPRLRRVAATATLTLLHRISECV